jgi:putative ABC transport system permease protein
MNLLKISWSNIRHKPGNTILSIVLLSFGIGIISLMMLLNKQIGEKFDRNIKDIDFVLAAKGSPLQSILANVYHVDAPTGNIKVSEAARIIKNPMVKEAIPLAYGDNFEKWRIVGTTVQYPNHYGCKAGEGRLFEKPFEATIGSLVANETGLKIGSTFTSNHGFDALEEGDEEGHHHDTPYTVVGIFEQSNSVIDNLILTPVESTWMVHDHGHEEGEHAEEGHDDHAADEHEVADTTAHVQTPDTAAQNPPLLEGLTGEEVMKQMAQRPNAALLTQGRKNQEEEGPEKEMTAYLIVKNNKQAFGMLSAMTENTTMQLANVAVENNRLLNNFGIGMDTIMAIAILIAVISFVSIFISLYNSLKERRYELALMRTMGGTRNKLFSLIMLEGLLLVVSGFVVGMLLSRIGLLILGNFVRENFKYNISDLGMTGGEVILLIFTLTVGVLASLLPAMRALDLDISKTLSHA